MRGHLSAQPARDTLHRASRYEPVLLGLELTSRRGRLMTIDALPLLVVILTVVFASLIQSIFGVGLLLLGTPVLLITGFSFPETLTTLLPGSLAISLLQLKEDPESVSKLTGKFLLWCVPPLIVSLILVLVLDLEIEIEIMMTALLTFVIVLRLIPRSRQWLTRAFRKATEPWLALTGAVHGFTNLGGGLLIIYASSTTTRKLTARSTVALGYTIFAVAQLCLLAIFSPSSFGFISLISLILSPIIFYLFGRRTFNFVRDALFQHLLTALLGAMSGVLLLRVFSVI